MVMYCFSTMKLGVKFRFYNSIAISVFFVAFQLEKKEISERIYCLIGFRFLGNANLMPFFFLLKTSNCDPH